MFFIGPKRYKYYRSIQKVYPGENCNGKKENKILQHNL